MTILSNPPFREMLSYDRETGEFRWLVTHHRIKVGDVAGTAHPAGYWSICMRPKRYLAHRLAWFFETGEWPEGQIDHINGDRRDNRIKNLRLASPSQNVANGKRRSTNTSGFKGVSYLALESKWRASIMRGGRQIYLGRFASPEAAHAAYVSAAIREFGEFAHAGS